MINEKLVCHISHTFWDISKDAIRTCLQQFTGELHEEVEPTKRNLDINCTIKRNWSNCHEGAILDKPIIFSSLPNDLTSRIERIEKHLNLS